MNILVTRPDERGQALVESLNQAGIFALHQPLFQFESGRELPILSMVFLLEMRSLRYQRLR